MDLTRNMEVHKILIADIGIEFATDMKLERSEAFQNFETSSFSECQIPYQVELLPVSELQLPKGSFLYEEGRCAIYRTDNGGYLRCFWGTEKDKKIYAVGHYDLQNKKINVEYLEGAKVYFQNVQGVFDHIAWENILLNEKRLMLHASFVKTPYGGLAFSGPSGVGKSTQGDLWVRYGEGKLINGDKLILGKEEQWLGYGSPYAGSSKCFVSDKCPLRGIFFLSQGKECILRRMSVAEGFKYIYSGLTLNRWEGTFVESASELVQRLAEEIPVYEFVCTPDVHAVDFLKTYLG